MTRKLVLLLLSAALLQQANAQCSTCSATNFTLDLSASIDTVVTIQSTRNGNCCSGSNCIMFYLTINPAVSFVNLTVANPAPTGSAFYQIDCGTQANLGTPICVVGRTTVCISYCKPGNDNAIYTITAAGAILPSQDITVREGCTGEMSITGLIPSTITWTSIFPGSQGAYNSLLSCSSGCLNTTVKPLPGAPAYIDYMVSGSRICGGIHRDTIRVFTTPQPSVSITPANPALCASGGGTLDLTANVANGDQPYNYLWNTGETTSTITVSSFGTYTVAVTDSRGCDPSIQTTVLSSIPNPAAPSISSNSPVCEGSSIQLSAPFIAGAIYQWSGPGGFSSDLQNPVINNASAAHSGSYSLKIINGGCSSPTSFTNVVVNALPAPPLITGNATVCENNTLTLSANAIPGATYQWTGPNNFSSSGLQLTIQNVTVSHGGNYYATATINGCSGAAAMYNVQINTLPSAPAITVNNVCEGSDLMLVASDIIGASYSWSGPNGFNSSDQNPVIQNAATNASGVYNVRATVAGCTGSEGSALLTVFPIPAAPNVSNNGPVCEGTPVMLTASGIAGANYAWSGPNGFSSGLQNPVIINNSTTASGQYEVVAILNGCSSPVASTNILIHPIPAPPVLTPDITVCEGNSATLSASPVANGFLSWSGPNGFTSNQPNITFNDISQVTSGMYYATVTVNGCESNLASTNIIVNALPPAPGFTNSNLSICEGQNLALQINPLQDADYQWSGPNGFLSNMQNPVIPNISSINQGTYYVSATLNGCTGNAGSVLVTVNNTPAEPVIYNSGPVCEGSEITLTASGISGAQYRWTGPNGFLASGSQLIIGNATSVDAGLYSVEATLNGCTGNASTTIAVINKPSIAYAGNDQLICADATAVNLLGTISGGSYKGLWSSSGGGSFSPSDTTLNAIYTPSPSDISNGSVSLQLSSRDNGACTASVSEMMITFRPMPIVNAGPDQVICTSTSAVQLNAEVMHADNVLWSSSGSGRFNNANNTHTNYTPGRSDIQNGKVYIKLVSTNNGPCAAATDEMIINIRPDPIVKLEREIFVLENNSITLSPTVIGNNLIYQWSPAVFLNASDISNPLCTPGSDITYKLMAEDEWGCKASADVNVNLLKKPEIPNVFTPNGDGINDRWEIKHLSKYPDCSLEIYNRYGQLVYKSTGYNTPWDGTTNGKILPAGTYYYIINPKINTKAYAGFVDILR